LHNSLYFGIVVAIFKLSFTINKKGDIKMFSLTRPRRTYTTLFDSLFDDYIDSTSYNKTSSKSPRVNIEEDDSKFSIIAEMPGIEEKDLDVSVDNGLLTINYEHKNEEEEKSDNGYYKEFSVSSYKRQFKVPNKIDEKKITAKYKNGILTVDLPKDSKKIASKKIKILSE
jgi:HSP20 family protein